MKRLSSLLIVLLIASACSKSSSDPSPLPELRIDSVGAVTYGEARVYVTVAGEGSSAVTSAGVAFGTDSLPTTYDSVRKASGYGAGRFSLLVSGLNSGTKYHARGFATNSGGTGYSADKPFTTIPLTATLDVDSVSNAFLRYVFHVRITDMPTLNSQTEVGIVVSSRASFVLGDDPSSVIFADRVPARASLPFVSNITAGAGAVSSAGSPTRYRAYLRLNENTIAYGPIHTL